MTSRVLPQSQQHTTWSSWAQVSTIHGSPQTQGRLSSPTKAGQGVEGIQWRSLGRKEL